MPKISVIVPVYKVEEYLPRCLESLLNQTFTDFEVILVDDGSPDNSGKICDEYAAKDTRIRVVHQENSGVSAARNVGLDIGTGEYIAFCDSDDSLEPDYLKALCDVSSDYDIVCSGVQNHEADGTVKNGILAYDFEIQNLNQENILSFVEKGLIDCVYAKRYRRKTLEIYHIRFDENLSMGEDGTFNARYICKCNNLRCIPYYHYCYYRYDIQVATLSSFNESFFDKMLITNQYISDSLKERIPNIEKTEIWKKRQFNLYYISIWNILRSNEYSVAKKRKMIQKIMQNSGYIAFCKKLDFYMKNDSMIWRRLFAMKKSWILVLVYQSFFKRDCIRRKNKIEKGK